MDKADILIKIEQILPKIQNWITYKEASFEPDELAIVKELAPVLLPGKTINFACAPCGSELLNIIWSWYQREK